MLFVLLPLLLATLAFGILSVRRFRSAPTKADKIVISLTRQVLLPSIVAGGLPLIAIAITAGSSLMEYLVIGALVATLYVACGISVLLVPGACFLRSRHLTLSESVVFVILVGAAGGGLLLMLATALAPSLSVGLFGAACGAWSALVWSFFNRGDLKAWTAGGKG